MASEEQSGNGGSSSTALKAAVAAAATGAAAYGIQRVRAAHGARSEDTGTRKRADEDGAGDRGGFRSKREELTQTLSSKVVDAKKAASKLKPGSTNRSVLDVAWDSASGHVIPLVKDAASSLGAAAAKRGPAIVRDELIPGFIEGFEKER